MNLRHFKSPLKQHRPSPFWAWNDELDPAELQRQIAGMQQQGFGGYFMHSRAGLATDYLGEPWMAAVAACLKQGKKVGTESWLYDEDTWPSGYAGGLVTRRNPRAVAKTLCEHRSPRPNSYYIASFDVDLRENLYRRLRSGDSAFKQFVGYTVRPEAPSNTYGGQPYVDLMDPEAVETFLQLTYDAYARRFGKDFGEFMPGIFTDEPNVDRQGGLPWTGAFPEEFLRRRGYNLLERLPDLFYDTPTAPKTRHDYWKTVGQLFCQNFAKKLYDRCERDGLALTGHYLWEEPLRRQLRCSGALMPLYEYMHVPGVDHLRRRNCELVTLKQCSSVAHQFGRTRVLSEIYGCSGHSMTFEDQKWLADIHFAMGITLMCQHLALYTMKGDAKRDYPPTFSYHQPYYDHYKAMNDYLARCGVATSTGKFAADVLLLHPGPSVWCHMHASGDDKKVAFYEEELLKLIQNLLAIHRDFDFGDEEILSRHGKVHGASFDVNEMSYRAVVVPPSLTWSSKTFDMLSRFTGPVIFVGEPPTMIDAEPNGQWEDLLGKANVRRIGTSKAAVQRALNKAVARDVSIAGRDRKEIADVYYHHRIEGTKHVYFLCNTSHARTYDATLSVAVRGKAHELDPVTGDSVEIPSRSIRTGSSVRTILHPVGSRVIVIEQGKRPITRGAAKGRQTSRTNLKGPWEFERKQPNSMPLDYARLAIRGGKHTARLPMWQVRDRVKTAFNLVRYEGLQPWLMKRFNVHVAPGAAVNLQYEFHVTTPPTSLSLVVEQAERFAIKVNGRDVSSETTKWYFDRQFGRIDITGVVKAGVNTVELDTLYQWDTSIEDVYVVGEFGMRRMGDGRYSVSGEPDVLEKGSWTEQGYPFYAGNMTYKMQLNVKKLARAEYTLRLTGCAGTLFGVAVNGKDCGLITWAPWEADVTKAVKNGRNDIEISVIGSLRNTMGPLHHTAGDELDWVGPGEFRANGHWTDEYQFAQYGMLGKVDFVVSK